MYLIEKRQWQLLAICFMEFSAVLKTGPILEILNLCSSVSFKDINLKFKENLSSVNFNTHVKYQSNRAIIGNFVLF